MIPFVINYVRLMYWSGSAFPAATNQVSIQPNMFPIHHSRDISQSEAFTRASWEAANQELHQQKTFVRSFFYLYNVHKWPTCEHRPSLKSNNVKETVCRVLPQYDDTCDFTTCIKSGNRIYPWNSCFATMLFLWKYICNHLKWHLDLIIMRLFSNNLVNNLKEN